MEQILNDKLASILRRSDFLFADYQQLSSSISLKDLNMVRVRGSVRLTNMRIVLPKDTDRARRKVLNYSYK
jgi:hypothetical protein